METTVWGNTADGHVYGSSATYTTARSTAATADGTSVKVGQETGFKCHEGFVSFDVDAAVGLSYGQYVIDSVRLFMKPAALYDTTEFTIEAVTKDWGATLGTADWVPYDSISGTVRWTVDSADLAAGVYSELTLGTWEAAGLDSDGNVYLMLYSTRHKAGTEPTTNEYVTFYSADEAGTGSDPYIIVTWHSIEPAGGFLEGALGPVTAFNRALTAAEVRDVMALGQVILDRALDSGTAVIEGVVTTRSGSKVPAAHVRAGWWIQNLDYDPDASDTPRPLLITGHSVDMEAGRNALTVGVDWMEDEIGVKMADLLAIPDPVEVTPVENAAADPTQPEPGPSADDAVWEGVDVAPESAYNAPLDAAPTPVTHEEATSASLPPVPPDMWDVWN
jgi:hypothetical protein